MLSLREIMVFAACTQLSTLAVTVAVISMCSALLNFLLARSSLKEDFCLNGWLEREKILRFLLGLSPAMPQRIASLAGPSMANLTTNCDPSTGKVCQLCTKIDGQRNSKNSAGIWKGMLLAEPFALIYLLRQVSSAYLSLWQQPQFLALTCLVSGSAPNHFHEAQKGARGM